MRSKRVSRSTGNRARPPGDDTRRGPAGPVRPAPDLVPPHKPDEHDAVLRPELIRHLREQIHTGSYGPPLDEVVERMAAFFVVDRAYLHGDPDTA
jgi:hypothetical protein